MEMIWLRLFFNVHIVSKSPAEISPPIGAFMELRSNSNLPSLVNLALNLIAGILLYRLTIYSSTGSSHEVYNAL